MQHRGSIASMKFRHSILFPSAILLFLGVLYLGNSTRLSNRPGSAGAAAAAVSPALSLPMLPEITEQGQGGAMPAAEAIPLRPPPAPVGGSIHTLFPDLETAVPDWRTFNPENITLALQPDQPISFHRTQTYGEMGRTIWVGRNDIPGAFVTSAATEHEYQAVLVIPGGDSYQFSVVDGQASVRKLTANFSCGTTNVSKTNTHVSAGLAVTKENSPGDPQPTAGIPANLTSATSTVDVLYFYNAAALAEYSSVDAMQTNIQANLAAANQTVTNSLITNFQWHFAGLVAISAYASTGNMSDDLSALSNSTSAAMVQYGADEGQLVIGGTSNYAGLAWVVGRYSVVLNSQLRYNVMAHEMGHNFGCNHDRITQGAADTDGLFNYGWRNNNLDPNIHVDIGDVMSYASTKLPYFSNPNISYTYTLGNFSWTFNIGVPIGQPGSAYAAKTMSDAAPSMAAYGTPPNSGPAFTLQPANQNAFAGTSVTFTTSATGYPYPTYQWQKNNVPVSGATDSSYTLTHPTTGDAGNYAVVATNSSGTATSAVATLTIAPTDLPAFSTQPVSQDITLGFSFTLIAYASGTPTPTYQWQKNGVNITNGVNIIGANTNSYTKINVSAEDAGNYTVVATNIAGSVSSSVATLTIGVAPAFTSQPTSQTGIAGNSVTFTAAASGIPIPTYQWQKDGRNIPDATSSSYVIASVVAGDAGHFQVVVSNPSGSAISAVGLLTVITPPGSVIMFITVE